MSNTDEVKSSNKDELDPYYEDAVKLFVAAKDKKPMNFLAT